MKFSKFSLGIFYGSLSGMTWGLNTLIIGIILTSSILLKYTDKLFVTTLSVAFLHDLFSALWLILNLIRKKKFFDLFTVLKRKIGIIMIVASILGGPIGMAGYLLGVKYIGPSYAASFSALYPALGSILSFIILKEKIELRIKIGVILSGFGILILSYSPIDIYMYPNYILGIIFSFFCVFGWALECVVAAYAMKYGEIDSKIAITLRQTISAIFYITIIIPFIKGYPLIKGIFYSNLIILLIFTALIGSISYLFWYKSIELIGAPRGMSLNITYVIWTMIFEKIYFKNTISMQFILASIIVIFGIILIAGNPKKMLRND